jgi:hypothetical protein
MRADHRPDRHSLEQTLLPQHVMGNQATLRLLAGQSSKPMGMQKKLTVGPVNDPLKHEADRVMRMPAPDVSISAAPPEISRKCAECEGEEKLQKREAGTAESAGAQAVPASVRRASH